MYIMSSASLKIVVNKENEKHPLQDVNIINALSAGISHTLKEMAQISCQFEKPFVGQNWIAPADGTGVLEMKSIKHRGFLHIHFPKEAILKIMENMLGEAPKEFNDEVLDGIGEITNIVYGAMKAKLNPMGYEFRMATPKAELTINLNKLERTNKQLIIPFNFLDLKCFIEIVLI